MNFSEVFKLVSYIKYLLTNQDMEILYKYAKEVPENGTIVDIGTAEGGSAFTMTWGSKESVKVYTIDPVESANFLHYRDAWNMEDKLKYIVKTSEEAVNDVPEEIDLLFIDGIHNYNGVMNDFNWYGSKVKKGGIIIFHDYYLYRNTIGKAIDEIVESGKVEKIEIVDSIYQNEKRIGMFVSRKV